MENLEVKSLIEKGLENVNAEVKKSADTIMAKVAEVETKSNETAEALKVQVTDLVNRAETSQKHLDSMDVRIKSANMNGSAEIKSFNDNLGEAIENATDELKNYAARGKGGEMSIQMKAAGDMSPSANFGGSSYANLTTDYRQGVLERPDNTIYLRNIIPSGTTDAATITYPQANGGEGAPAVWTPGTAKPQFDFDFISKTVNVQWIAGIVRVPRAMLDDVKFLRSYLQANMLKALLKAENAEILNGDGTGNHLLGLMPQASAYDGDYTVMVEQLVDAAHGIIKDRGFDASNIVMNSRDAVGIALNKASTSGLYDLPPGSVGFVDGRLTIAGLDVVTVGSSQLAQGDWLAGDFSATQLITRLNPEIRFFEQNKDDVEKNMVTIRIEERVALATYFPDAFVKNPAGV